MRRRRGHGRGLEQTGLAGGAGGSWLRSWSLRQLLTLTLTAAGQAAGFGLLTFATGFPSTSGIGPLGVVFPASGGVLVDDGPGNVRLFPSDSDGQDAATVPPVSGASYGPFNASGMARVGANLYLMTFSLNQIVQLNDNGTENKVVAPLTGLVSVAVNPLNGHLFVSCHDSTIFDVNPVTGSDSLAECAC